MQDEDLDDFFQGADGAEESAASASEPPMLPPRLGLLAGIGEQEFTLVARAAKLQHLEPGTDVFSQGDEADRFFILVDGAVEVERDGDMLATLGPGSFFGESALLVGGRRSATVRTILPSALWSVDYVTFEDVVSHRLLADDQAREEVNARLESADPEHFS